MLDLSLNVNNRVVSEYLFVPRWGHELCISVKAAHVEKHTSKFKIYDRVASRALILNDLCEDI